MGIVTTNLLNRFWRNGIKPIKEALDDKIDSSKIVKSTEISEEGFLMDGKSASEALNQLNSNIVNELADGVSECIIGGHLVVIHVSRTMNISDIWKDVTQVTHLPRKATISLVSADNGIYIGRALLDASGIIRVAFPDIKTEVSKTVQGEMVYTI